MLRRAAVLIIALTFVVPHQANAQGFTVSGAAAQGAQPGVFRFSFIAGAQAPVSLTYFKLFLNSPGWSFTGTSYTGADPFSPTGFGPLALAYWSPQQVDFDFWSDLGWFEINDGFVSYFDVAGQGTPGRTTFGYSATDINGQTVNGQGSLIITPEPLTLVLLGSGLAGLGAARLRRRKHSQNR
jgi:hypothetical protein